MSSIPRSVAGITAEWLNGALDDRTRGGATVTGVRAQNIGDGIGFLGEVARLHLTYDRDAPGAVTTMIAKTPTVVDELRHLGSLFGFYEKEHAFYAHLAASIEIDVPRAHCNLGDPAAGDYVLLLEDLGHMRAGDQLESCQLDEAIDVLRRIAHLHAAWWESPRLDDHASWLPTVGSPYFAMVKGAFIDSVSRPGDLAAFLPPWVFELAARMVDQYDDWLERAAGKRPHTLIHGDFRLDNMMFGRDGDPRGFVLLDWQLPMRLNAMFEVMYFCAGSLGTDVRRLHERRLVAEYHDALVAGGVTSYTADDCWRDYQATSISMLGYVMPLVADVQLEHLNERGQRMMTTLMERYVAAIDDHRTSEPVTQLVT